MNELKFNVVQSIGEITANFDEFKNQVSQELEKYKSKEFTEDTKKDAKKDLAELRKKKAAVNERRIEVKKEYMKPYDEFEAKVKELITLIDEPITLIDYKVKEFEEKNQDESDQKDGKSTSSNIKINQNHINSLRSLFTENGIDESKVLVLYKVQKIEALTINQYKNAFDHVKELKESCSV